MNVKKKKKEKKKKRALLLGKSSWFFITNIIVKGISRGQKLERKDKETNENWF